MNRVFGFLGVHPQDIDDTAAKNTRSYNPISETARKTLQEFYAPYNQKLFDMIGRHLEW